MAEKFNKNNFDIDMESVKKLVDLVKVSKIGRIRVSFNGVEIEVESQQPKAVVNSVMGAAPAQVKGYGDEVDLDSNSEDDELESGHIESSPIVGTFYASPSPGKPAFVEVGSEVKKGDTIYIIESMKLMNEVKSGFDGVVKKIFVSSGDPVEYGQSIMLIE